MSVTIVTNYGNLKFEIFCDLVPRISKNFLCLAASGFYEGLNFHRNIAGFAIQGGDPEGTGKGGRNYLGGFEEDEFVSPSLLSHDQRGILSFSNFSKPNSVGSQFFILFSPQTHLDGKFSIFGKLVEGFDVLKKLEEIPVEGKKFKPVHEILIEKMNIHENPIAEKEWIESHPEQD